MNDMINALGVQYEQLKGKRSALIDQAAALTRKLNAVFGDSDEIGGSSGTVTLDENADGDAVYGFLYYRDSHLGICYRTREDDRDDVENRVPVKHRSYTSRPLEECDIGWLTRVMADEVVSSLLANIRQSLSQDVDDVDHALRSLQRLLSAESAAIDAEMSQSLDAAGDDNLARLWRDAVDATHADSADALTRCSRFLEAVCAKILRERRIALPKDKSMSPLVKACLDTLAWPDATEVEGDVRQLTGGIQSICNGIGALRTHFGTAHGASSHLPPLDLGYAVFVKQATVAAATFLLDRHQASSPATRADGESTAPTF